MPSAAVLVVEELVIRYGRRSAVDGVSFAVGRGELFGLLGANGSGKSSTLAAIAGHLEPASGRILLDGFGRRDNPSAYARRLGFVPQEPAVYDELTPATNLAFFGGLYGLGGHELRRRMARALDVAGLTANANRPVRQLSGGQRQRVNLACALLHGPSLLLLDEPTVALDTVSRADFFAHLDRLRDDGTAVVLTTHHLDEAERWCGRVALLTAGRLTALGPATGVLREAHVLEVDLSAPLDAGSASALADRVRASATLTAVGLVLTLRAADVEGLAAALGALAAQGLAPVRLRTPPPRLAARGVPCPDA